MSRLLGLISYAKIPDVNCSFLCCVRRTIIVPGGKRNAGFAGPFTELIWRFPSVCRRLRGFCLFLLGVNTLKHVREPIGHEFCVVWIVGASTRDTSENWLFGTTPNQQLHLVYAFYLKFGQVLRIHGPQVG